MDYERSSWKYMSYERSSGSVDLDSFKIGGQTTAPHDIIASFIDVPTVKGGGSAYGGKWKPAKTEDERFLGKPGEIKQTHSVGKRGGYDRETKIGDDGRAVMERHHTDHDTPSVHSDPHDHIIDWSGGFPKPGPPINYPNGAPEFKRFGGIRQMAYAGTNSLEENRFKTISDFKWCVNCGGEIQFEWKGLVYGIFPKLQKTPDAPLQMLISQVHIDPEDMAASEKWCDSADDVLVYMVSGDRLRDVITQVIVWDRTI